VHDEWTSQFLLRVEKAATEPSSKTLVELLDEIRADKKLSTAAHWDDPNKIRDGLLKRAPDETIHYAKQWTVSPGELEEKTAQMINASVYFTAAAQHPPKQASNIMSTFNPPTNQAAQVKFDFYFMHCVNSSIFFPTFNAQPWLSEASKLRLLKFKGYLDLAMYASRRSPALPLTEITEYVPAAKDAAATSWPGIFARLLAFEDDGHAVKLGRAVAHGEQASRAYEGAKWARVSKPMWEKIGNMVIDSVEDTGATWVMSAGFEEAWREYGDRKGH
jgi:hypothetical protein